MNIFAQDSFKFYFLFIFDSNIENTINSVIYRNHGKKHEKRR